MLLTRSFFTYNTWCGTDNQVSIKIVEKLDTKNADFNSIQYIEHLSHQWHFNVFIMDRVDSEMRWLTSILLIGMWDLRKLYPVMSRILHLIKK